MPTSASKVRKEQAVPASLPPVDANNHYGRARETDSAIVETVDAEHGSHFEKFLFYRGLGNFELPMKLTALGNDRFEITNSGDEASGALLLMRIENGLVRFTRIDPDPRPLDDRSHAAGQRSRPSTSLPRRRFASSRPRACTKRKSLAMVNTWRSSWFGENGTRLLYLVPGKQTDELLPLKVEPAPDEQVRVLVGRLETITPEDCQRLVRRSGRQRSRRNARCRGGPSRAGVTGPIRRAGDRVRDRPDQRSRRRGRLEAILADIRSGK